jgi:hypothetical protein
MFAADGSLQLIFNPVGIGLLQRRATHSRRFKDFTTRC